MKNIIRDLVQKAMNNKKLLQDLKTIAVNNKYFEIAAHLREIEIKKFPETPEIKQIKKDIGIFNIGLRMLDVSAPDKLAYKILELSKNYKKITVDNITDINTKANNIFD